MYFESQARICWWIRRVVWQTGIKVGPLSFPSEMREDRRLLGAGLRRKIKPFFRTCYISDAWWACQQPRSELSLWDIEGGAQLEPTFGNPKDTVFKAVRLAETTEVTRIDRGERRFEKQHPTLAVGAWGGSHKWDRDVAACVGRRKKRKGSGSQGKEEFKEGVMNCVITMTHHNIQDKLDATAT